MPIFLRVTANLPGKKFSLQKTRMFDIINRVQANYAKNPHYKNLHFFVVGFFLCSLQNGSSFVILLLLRGVVA